MGIRSISLCAAGLAIVLFATSTSPAQGPGPDAVKKLEAELEKLRDQVKETEAKLAKAKESSSRKPGFEKFGKGKGGFDFKGKGGFGKGGFGKGGFGPRGFPGMKKEDFKKEFKKDDKGRPETKLDRETIKQKYEFYKKLYEGLPKDAPRSKGRPEPKTGRPGDEGSIEARLDRLTRELQQLRNELKKR